ncbi:MAG: hypothetical protein K1X74_04260 [Pirellulales bacterium]|nr:hypothetical protein [Pirellulales bacterium]
MVAVFEFDVDQRQLGDAADAVEHAGDARQRRVNPGADVAITARERPTIFEHFPAGPMEVRETTRGGAGFPTIARETPFPRHVIRSVVDGRDGQFLGDF